MGTKQGVMRLGSGQFPSAKEDTDPKLEEMVSFTASFFIVLLHFAFPVFVLCVCFLFVFYVYAEKIPIQNVVLYDNQGSTGRIKNNPISHFWLCSSFLPRKSIHLFQIVFYQCQTAEVTEETGLAGLCEN